MVLTLALIGCVAAADSTNDHVIQVSGSGSVTGTPDRVQISFAVETENPDVKIAQANNALAMNTVVDALAAAGVPRDQMKTTGLYDHPGLPADNKGILSGTVKTYQVTNTLQVTLKDTNMTGQIIDTAVNAGANQVNSIQFMLSDEQAQALRSQALYQGGRKRQGRCGCSRSSPQCYYHREPGGRYQPGIHPGRLRQLRYAWQQRQQKRRQLRRPSSPGTSPSPHRYPITYTIS